MPPVSSDSAEHAPGAVEAFLKGVERRAWVLAHAQCGDPRAAEIALAATLMRFRHGAAGLPMAQWPLRVWSLLLARPELRNAPGDGAPGALRGLSAGPRAVLLLRLVAGLDEAAIAQVMGVSPAAARLSMGRALQALPAPHGDSLARLDTALRTAVRELPADRAQRLAMLRQAGADRAAAAGRAPPAPVRHRLLLPLLWLTLTAVLAAFIGSFFLPPAEPPLQPGEQRELPLALPTTLSPESAVLASPDFDEAFDPGSGELIDDLLFLSWLAGQLQEQEAANGH